MTWTIANFGKYKDKGRILPQIVFDDPDWFFWAHEKEVFKGALKAEAEQVAERARRIQIPQDGGERKVAEYVIHWPRKRFGGVELVEASRPRHVSPSPTFRRDHLDLSVARSIAEYDKFGCKVLVRDVKAILFGSRSARMTRQRAEWFFDNDENFDLT